MSKRILIADDESTIRETLAAVLREAQLSVVTAADGLQAVQLLAETPIDVALVDIRMPRLGGMEVLAKAKEISPDTHVIVITAFGTVENAVAAIKLGASDYVTKPFVFDDILIKIERLLDMQRLANENRFLLTELEGRHRFEGIIGTSRGLQEVLAMVRKLMHTRTSALITGESGTGKELVARAIHYNGTTEKGRFVPINCAALPEALAESELFGHKRGSFTGATRDKPGLFEVADGGTVFLDEISSMSMAVQAKLLRAIEEKRIQPVGATEPTEINVRILCASNRDLKKEVEAGRFRDDLYYRLNVVEIHVPPLRERRDDIPPLVDHFVAEYSHELGKPRPSVSDRALRAMMAYSWPGNVRELENVIERAIIFADNREIDLQDLPFASKGIRGAALGNEDLKSALRAYEKQHIACSLESNDFDKNATAHALRIGLSSLYRKIDELDIEVPNGRQARENGGHSADANDASVAAQSVSGNSAGTAARGKTLEAGQA